MSETKYYDKNGKQILRGMFIKHEDEKESERVYETVDGDLGLNASNKDHKDYEELYQQLYPLHQFDTRNEWEIVESV